MEETSFCKRLFTFFLKRSLVKKKKKFTDAAHRLLDSETLCNCVYVPPQLCITCLGLMVIFK